MTRRNAEDKYEYPLWAEEIIPYRVIRAQIIRDGLERFEQDICQQLMVRLLNAKRKGKKLNIHFGYKVIRSVLNNTHAKIKRERIVKDKLQRKSLAQRDRKEQEGPLNAVINKDLIESVVRRVPRLDVRDQMILEQRAVDDYTFKRIAKTVGYKESNVRIRYHKIIRQLRTLADEIQKQE